MANAEGCFASFGQHARGGLNPSFRHRQHHAEPAIEHAQHFIGADIPGLGQEGEDRRHGPAAGLQHCRHTRWQHTRQIARQPAAGDMRRRMQ